MTATVLVLLLATFLGAVAQTVAGFGFAIVTVPLYMTVLHAERAVGTVAILSFVNVAIVAWSLRGQVPWAAVRLLLAGSLCGMPPGLALLLGLSGEALRVAVGVVSIAMAAAIGFGLRLRTRGAGATLGVGFVAGVLTTSIGINGPPIVLFLQALRFPPEAFRAAVSTFFALNSVVSISIFLSAGVVGSKTLGPVALALPTVFFGHWVGYRLLPRFSPTTFRRFVLALLVASASTSIVHGLARAFG